MHGLRQVGHTGLVPHAGDSQRTSCAVGLRRFGGVVHQHLLGGVLCGLQAACHHHRDRLAEVINTATGQQGKVGHFAQGQQRIGWRHVQGTQLVGVQHRQHALAVQSGLQVQAEQPGPCIAAAHKYRVQHAGQRHIMHIQAAPGEQTTVFHAGQAVRTFVCMKHRLRRHESSLQGFGA